MARYGLDQCVATAWNDSLGADWLVCINLKPDRNSVADVF